MAHENVGRPKSEIDWDKVDDLLIADCSGVEIAANLGINPATLYDRCFTDKGILFSQYSQEMKSKGDSLLRKAQLDKALTGDNTMMVWLGKNRLKQRDKEEDSLKDHIEALKKLDEFIKSYTSSQTASNDASNIVNTNSKSE